MVFVNFCKNLCIFEYFLNVFCHEATTHALSVAEWGTKVSGRRSVNWLCFENSFSQYAPRSTQYAIQTELALFF